jgi:Transposase DNA-binding/Transposase Tn5 dimerisation domain
VNRYGFVSVQRFSLYAEAASYPQFLL